MPPHRDLETLFNLTRFLFSNSGPNFFVPDAIILFQVVCIGGEGFALSLSLPPSFVRLFVGAPGDLQIRLFSLPKICSGFEIECSQHFDLIYFLERRFL